MPTVIISENKNNLEAEERKRNIKEITDLKDELCTERGTLLINKQDLEHTVDELRAVQIKLNADIEFTAKEKNDTIHNLKQEIADLTDKCTQLAADRDAKVQSLYERVQQNEEEIKKIVTEKEKYLNVSESIIADLKAHISELGQSKAKEIDELKVALAEKKI